MTPRQLYALRKRRIEIMQWTELMFSRLTAATCNFGFSHPERPVEETAFMIHPFKTEPNGAPPVRQQEPQEPQEQEAPGDTLLRLMEELPAGFARRVN